MKHKLLALGIIVLAMVAFGTTLAGAQTTANGPYYATPSWDQTLPSSTRFIVLSNFGSAAVLDRETGLVWERSPSTSTYIWWYAQDHCNDLALGNRKGWGVPTQQELASLVDFTQFNPALPSGHPFTNVQVDSRYWSATTDTTNTGYAWVVDFVFGTGALTKFFELRVWCVRGGQGFDPQ